MADQNRNNQTVTWNSGGTTFDGYKLNVIDTASAAASLLLNLQVGGVAKFTVRKDGLTATLGGLLMKQSAGPTPTVEGTLEWDSTAHHFAVGINGTGTRKVGKAPTVQIISTPGAFVYTPTAGARFADFEAVAGGGAGGNVDGQGANTGGAGGGGASGFYGSTGPIDITGAATFSGSIGAAGAVSGSASGDGGGGGSTSITVGATTYTWGAGAGGGGMVAGGTIGGSQDGGTPGVGTNVVGSSAPGEIGVYNGNSGTNGTGGNGASSPFGNGGKGVHLVSSGQSNGGTAAGFGAGGAGGVTINTSNNATGSAGRAGYMRVWEYY